MVWRQECGNNTLKHDSVTEYFKRNTANDTHCCMVQLMENEYDSFFIYTV